MAPALRMTRSIKEKLKIFLQFDSHLGLPFSLLFGTLSYPHVPHSTLAIMPARSSFESTNNKHVLTFTAWHMLHYFDPNGPPTQHDFTRRRKT